VERALKDNGTALEAARAEVERLRSDLAVSFLILNNLPRLGASNATLGKQDFESMKAAQETHNRIVEERETLAARVQELEAFVATLEANHEAKQAEAVVAAVAAVDSRCKELETALAKVRPSRVSMLDQTIAHKRLRQISAAHAELSAKSVAKIDSPSSDKSSIGYQHIIRDLTSENADQKQRMQDLLAENDALTAEMEAMRKVSALTMDSQPVRVFCSIRMNLCVTGTRYARGGCGREVCAAGEDIGS
jgi:cell division protein FtsB